MGKGDKRSRKGKIFKGSYGNTRKHKVKKAGSFVAPAVKASAPAVEAEVVEKAAPKKKRAPKKAK